jgi:hypothetical protein
MTNKTLSLISDILVNFSIAAFAFMVVISAFALSGFSSAVTVTAAPNVVASMTVLSTCEISLSNSVITLPATAPGSFAPTDNGVVTDSNPGNLAGNVVIYGGNWIGTGSNTFYVTNTVWNPSSSPTQIIGNQLTSSPFTSLLQIPAAGSSTIYFGANVPSGQAADTYSQNIVIETSC